MKFSYLFLAGALVSVQAKANQCQPLFIDTTQVQNVVSSLLQGESGAGKTEAFKVLAFETQILRIAHNGQRINLKDYSVPKGFTHGDLVAVLMKDGISYFDGHLIGIKGSRLNLVVEQTMPKTNPDGSIEKRFKVTSVPMADLLMTTFMRVQSEVIVETTSGKVTGLLSEVQKTQIKLEDGSKIPLSEIQSINSNQARKVSMKYSNKERGSDNIEVVEIKNGLLLKKTDSTIWVLEMVDGKPVLHKISNTEYKISEIEFHDASPVARNQKLDVKDAGIFDAGTRIQNSTRDGVQQSIIRNFSGQAYAIQPVGASSRRAAPIQGVTLDNPQGLRVFSTGTVEFSSPSTRIATLENRLFRNANPATLPKGNIYSFVILAGEKPEIVMGLIEGKTVEGFKENQRYAARLGVQPIRLAQGREVLSEGEIRIDENGQYQVLVYEKGDYVERVVRHSSLIEIERAATYQAIQDATSGVFKDLFGYAGQLQPGTQLVEVNGKLEELTTFLNYKYGVSPGIPEVSIKEIRELTERSQEFRDLNPGIVGYVRSLR